MKLIVSGMSGFVGGHLKPALIEGGNAVVSVVRGLTAGEDDIAAPLELSSLPQTAMRNRGPFDAAIHLAALNPGRRDPASHDFAALVAANRDGTKAFFEAAVAAGARHLVLLSTANVHAPQAGRITENSPIEPISPYARSKAEAERVASEIARAVQVRLTILRPAPVYGRGGRGMVGVLQRLAASRTPIVLPAGLGARSVLSIDSLVDAILAVLERSGTREAIYLVADETARTPREIIEALRAQRGRSPRIFELPQATNAVFARIPRIGGKLAKLDKPFVLDWRPLAADTRWSPEGDTVGAMSRAACRPNA